MIDKEDYDARRTALGHATHDERGESSASDVIERAQVYYEFLAAAKRPPQLPKT